MKYAFFKGRRWSTLRALALMVGLVGVACGTESSNEAGAEADATGKTAPWATPDWDTRAAWYLTPQGSHLIDYDVFLALERAGGTEPFAVRDNLEGLGFVYPPDEAGRTLTVDERLPLGMVKDTYDSEKRDYVGLNCSACHTGEIRIKGKRLLVDGGQPFIEFETFFSRLQDAIGESISDYAKNGRVCKTLGGSAAECAKRLDDAKVRIDGIQSRNVLTTPGGPGRLDAISRILNEVFGGQLGGETAQPVAVPVSYPHVWDAPRLSCVQTNCLSQNSLTRNVGEVLGVFGHVSIGATGVASSSKLENLYKLEKSLESLASPKWNTKLFGSINAKNRDRGATIFKDTCANCHKEPYKSGATVETGDLVTETGGGKTISVWKVTTVPFQTVGTDPSFITVHGARTVNKPELTAFFDSVVKRGVAGALKEPLDSPKVAAVFEMQKADQTAKGIRKADGSILAIAMLGAVTSSIEVTQVAAVASASGRNAEELRHELEFNRGPGAELSLTNYRARPLNGIAYTAPFGHNGAWPTLRDMLAKEADRPTQFPVRPRTFDPKRVGLDTTPAKEGEKLFIFDTAQKGNSRSGHTWGTDLSSEDKDALIEYLKSI